MAIDVAALQRQLLGTFFEESFEGLELLESGLLALESAEGQDSTETINDIFRVAHSLKGGAGSFGLVDVGELGHALETLLEAFRAGKLAPNGELLSILLESVDCMRGLLEALKAGTEPPRERSHLLCQRLTQAAAHAEAAPTPAAAPEAPRREGRAFRIVFKPLPSLLEIGNEPVRLLRELSLLGTMQCQVDVSKVPSLSELTTTDLKLSWEMTLEGDTTREEVLEVFSWVDQDAEVTVTEVSGEGPASASTDQTEGPAAGAAVAPKEPAPGAAASAANADSAKREQKSADARDAGLGSIRVGVDKIDLLMNMVGELVITQSMLGELESDEPLTAHRIERLREGLGQLARSTRSLQESVMSLRSMPISVVFNRFPRLIHDLSRQLNKQVELKISGQTTELDKTVLEKLGDPLVHLVRNSMDHGLEPADERRASGKNETGTLTLAAYHRGGDIVVEVRDDGRGINREKVLKRAREVGLITEDAVVTDELIRDLLFAPGFSTAAKVSDLSGRGVGMDVVRRNVRALGGEVFVDSTPGKGTCISLRLPLTLAIIDGQLIRLGPHSYVVPLLSIVESVEVERSRVGRVQGRDIYRLRDDLIPMIDLASVLGLQLGSAAKRPSLMVIVEADGERIGLMVSELLAQQQVVVKSLETNYGRIEGLAGATILGDGNVAFILDSGGIGRLIKSTQRDETRAA